MSDVAVATPGSSDWRSLGPRLIEQDPPEGGSQHVCRPHVTPVMAGEIAGMPLSDGTFQDWPE